MPIIDFFPTGLFSYLKGKIGMSNIDVFDDTNLFDEPIRTSRHNA